MCANIPLSPCFLWGVCLEVESLDRLTIVRLDFGEPPRHFPQRLRHPPPAMHKGAAQVLHILVDPCFLFG